MAFWLMTPVAAYLGLVVLVYFLQDILVFPGTMSRGPAELPLVQGVTTGELSLPDGTRFRIAEGEPAGAPRGVLVFFVGNGEDLASGVQWAGELTGYGVSTVVAEYPGYGKSGGKPCVESFLQAADASAAFALEKAGKLGVPLLVAGSSIGTFSATYLASQGVGTRLLLLAPPTSTVEAGSSRYPWLPVRMLLKHRFDNLGPAALVRCPVLVVHGDQDVIVPAEMGQRVAEAMRGDFVLAVGHGHTRSPLSPTGQYAARIRAFLLE